MRFDTVEFGVAAVFDTEFSLLSVDELGFPLLVVRT